MNAPLTFKQWQETVPGELTGDPLWRIEAYRVALFVTDLAWRDVTKLAADPRTRSVADQLFRAVGSISANIAEGYGRISGKDEARIFEYALGSAREARGWYYQGRHVLTEPVAHHRMQLLTQIVRLLLTMIPVQRNRVREDSVPYVAATSSVLEVALDPDALSPLALTTERIVSPDGTRNTQHE